jgi:hypothetical protein
MIDEHTPIVRDAAQALLDRKILARVGFAERTDLVRVPSEAALATAVADAPVEAAEEAPSSGVVTTDTERLVFEYVRTRLPYLLGGDEDLFSRLKHVSNVDHKTVFCVYYKQERKGRLFNFWEARGPRFRFEFPLAEGSETIDTDALPDIDSRLIAMFRRRVEEMG